MAGDIFILKACFLMPNTLYESIIFNYNAHRDHKGFTVADVISINDKLQLAEEKKTEIIHKQKILAVQKVFHCTHCASKCAKCGTQITMDQRYKEKDFKLRVPYRFCESCSEEYINYIEYLQGGRDPEYYWQNEAWLNLWKKWIDYQSAIDRYIKSKEFIQLLHELKQIRFDK